MIIKEFSVKKSMLNYIFVIAEMIYFRLENLDLLTYLYKSNQNFAFRIMLSH